MNNVARIHQLNDQTGLEVVNVQHFKTSDGQIFANRLEAERHQNLLQKVKDLVDENHTSKHFWSECVHGTTLRGNGWEDVKANPKSLEKFLLTVLTKLSDEGYIFIRNVK